MPSLLLAHGDEIHTSNDEKRETQRADETASDELLLRYKMINRAYLAEIKPIFKKKCFDCHSNRTNYPWYYGVPGIKQMIDKDIKEGRSHINFSRDFPFISHETPMNDLKSLREIGLEGGMPPLGYMLGHWESRLSDEDKAAIVRWSEYGMDLLGETR
jgi:hypothetical protein